MNSSTKQGTATKLFEITAGWNSLRGKFTRGERLTVNVVRYVSAGWAAKPYYRVEVTNARGETVSQILKTASTRATAVGWADGNYGHQRVKKGPDFSVSNHGSVCVVNLLTPAAHAWVEENVQEGAQWWGKNGLVVEPRYLENLVAGMEAAGLSRA